MNEQSRTIQTQQRSLAKYERSMSSIRHAAEEALKLPVEIDNADYQLDAVKRGAAIAITDNGEVQGLYIPVGTLRKLGVVNG